MVYVLMPLLLGLGVLTLAGCAWGFTKQQPSDYSDTTPRFDVKRDLGGDYLSEGMIYDYTGKVVSRFKASMSGEFDENGGTLKEHFIYASGREDHRQWTITIVDDTHFTVTAPDLVGTGHGVVSGNSVQLKYKLKLNEDAGGHVLTVTDWMYLTDEGTILNRSQMKKFGIKVAELVAVFKHKDVSESVSFASDVPALADVN